MASVMELMRELKNLGELRKAGSLTPEQEQRLKEIKSVLDASMGKGNNSQPPRPAPGAPPARPATSPPTPVRPAPSPPPRSMTSPLPTAADINPKGNPNAFTLDMPEELAADLAVSAAKADAALLAQKVRTKPKNSDEAVQQLGAIQQTSGYTPPESHFGDNEYFSYGGGYEAMPDAPVELALIDPRTVELKRMQEVMASSASGESGPVIMPGGVFLDDFMELYTNKILSADLVLSDDEADANDPALLIPGKRKVTVHMVNGEVKRGIIQRMSRMDQGFTLLPQAAGRPEQISLQQVKAIFVTLNPGAAQPAPVGRNVTVTFHDKRSIQGASADYASGAPAFLLIPPPGRGGFERIIVTTAQCQDVR